MVDMTYRKESLWTHFMPVSDAGIELFKQLLTSGDESVLSMHATGFINQMRRAGYVVKKARTSVERWTKEDELLLNELLS